MSTSRAIRRQIALAARQSGLINIVGYSGHPDTLRAILWANAQQVGPVVRRPSRQGPSEQHLEDADTSVQYTDSGAPDYRYDQLEVEDWVAPGAAVGTPVLWDAVAGAPVTATIVGSPWTTRYTDAAPGYLPTTNDRIEDVGLPSGDFTVVTHFVLKDEPRITFVGPHGLVDGAAFRGFNLYLSGTNMLYNVRDAGGLRVGCSVTYAYFGPAIAVATYAASGAATLRLYRADTGALLASDSGTGPRVVDLSSHYLGSPSRTIDRASTDPSWQDVYTGDLLTAAQADAIADGTTPVVAGLARVRWGGPRSGVFDPANPDNLPIAGGTGLPVVAP